ELKMQFPALALKINNMRSEIVDKFEERCQSIESDALEMQQQIDSLEQYIRRLQGHEVFPDLRGGSYHLQSFTKNGLCDNVRSPACRNGCKEVLNAIQLSSPLITNKPVDSDTRLTPSETVDLLVPRQAVEMALPPEPDEKTHTVTPSTSSATWSSDSAPAAASASTEQLSFTVIAEQLVW
ncbi:unnamed protein product, partial [Prorocentrum cordatum]